MSETGDFAHPFATRRAGSHGFTLIEVLVVLAVTGLIGGLLFPAIERTIAFWQFRSAGADIRSGLERGRAKALRQDALVRFAILPGGDSFGVTGDAPDALPAGVRARAGTITFFRDGSSNGGRIEISTRSRHAAFSVSPDTGLVSITG